MHVKVVPNTSSYVHEPLYTRLFFSTLHHDAFSTNKRLLLRSPSSFSANESLLTRFALELRGVWRSFFIVSEVVWSHHSWVQCPTNWFPFLTSEVGALGWGRWLHINRVFPRHRTNSSPYLLHSHYRQLGWHMRSCISLLSLSKQTGTHLPIHTGMCTQYTHTHAHTSPLEWPPEDWERNRLPPPHTPTRWPTDHISANKVFSLLTQIPTPTLVVYFWRRQIKTSLLTSA